MRSALTSRFLPDDGEPVAVQGASTSSLAFRRSVVERLMPLPESMRINAHAFIELLAVLLAPVLALDERWRCTACMGEICRMGIGRRLMLERLPAGGGVPSGACGGCRVDGCA